jgi:hypothetical protein
MRFGCSTSPIDVPGDLAGELVEGDKIGTALVHDGLHHVLRGEDG